MIKLLKYELKCIMRFLQPIYVSFLIMSFLSGILNYIIIKNDKFEFISAFLNLTMYIVSIVFIVAAMFVPIMRYYSSMVKDEAYQTFCLPMDMKLIVLSKLILAVGNNIVSLILVILSNYILSDKGSLYLKIIDNKLYLFGEPIYFNLTLLIIMILLILICSYSMYNLLVFAAISIGTLINKNIISGSFLAGIFLYLLIIIFFTPVILIMMNMQENTSEKIMALFLIMCIAVLSIINILFFYICSRIFKEKPNLN